METGPKQKHHQEDKRLVEEKNILNTYIWKMPSGEYEEREGAYLSRLPAWRRERTLRLRIPALRMLSAGAWLLAEHVLEKEAGLRPADYEVLFGEHGKPEIRVKREMPYEDENGAGTDASRESIYFSLSHSVQYAACVAAAYPVGIDIETKDDPNLRVAERMFTEFEKKRIGDADSENRQTVFRDIWTEKEAYLKYTGEGLSVSLNQFFKNPETGEVIREKRTGSYVSSGRFDENKASISVCSPYPNLVLDIHPVFEL